MMILIIILCRNFKEVIYIQGVVSHKPIKFFKGVLPLGYTMDQASICDGCLKVA